MMTLFSNKQNRRLDRSAQLFASSLLLTLFALLLSANIAAATLPLSKIVEPPLGERWYSLSLNDEQTGFARQDIRKVAEGYEIAAVGSVKMLVLGFTREATTRERYLVKPDLSLRSFAIEQVLDGSLMTLTGDVTQRGIKVKVTTAAGSKEKFLKSKGPVYPGPLLNLYPLMVGATPGKVYRLNYLDNEGVKIKEVKLTVVGPEKLADGQETIHLQNDLYPFVSNDIWVDRHGNTILESVRDGLILTRAVDEASGRRFLVEAAVAKRDLVLDFSLVRIGQKVERPREMQGMVVELGGVPAGIQFPEGVAQQVTRQGGEVQIATGTACKVADQGVADLPSDDDLAATDRIPADHAEIVARKKELLGKEQNPRQRVQLLAQFVDKHLDDTVTDSQSAVESMRSRKGNCQSHSRLYAALARAAGIPTRFVAGLVYLEGKGFVYHSWAESYVGSWLTVDPTFGQVPADATHIKLVNGDSADAMATLAGVIGRITAKVLMTKY